LLDDLVIGYLDVNAVVGAQASGTPVNLHHLTGAFPDLEPVAYPIGAADLQRNARDQTAEKILSGKAEDDSGDSRPSEQSFELTLGVVAEAQHHQQRNEEDTEGKDLAEQFGNGRVLAPFEPGIPNVAVDERNHDRGAQKHECGTKVFTPIGTYTIGADRRVRGEREAKDLEKNAELDTSLALKNPPQRERAEVSDEKREHRRWCAITFDQCVKHRRRSLFKNRSRNKRRKPISAAQ